MGPSGELLEPMGTMTYDACASAFADQAVRLFLGDDSPVPRASSQHDHYEAITEADTLMKALLRLWAVQQTPRFALPLTYTDR